MDKSYFNTFRNITVSVKPSRTSAWFMLLFLLLFFSFNGVAQNGPNCPTGICIGPGGSITSGSLIVSNNAYYDNITIKNNQTLTVKSGSILYVGRVGTAATLQVVDFQVGCNIVIEPGASLVVNGLLNNSNNSNGVIFNGSVSVTGNVVSGTGSTIDGDGTLYAEGSITTGGTGSIFGSTGECTLPPCSGSQLNCTNQTNTISDNQTICSGAAPVTLTGSTIINPATYQWQQSTTSGANFDDIIGAVSSNFSPGSLITTTYYRRKQKVGDCTGTSSQVIVTVISATVGGTIAGGATICTGTNSTTLTLSGHTGTITRWESSLDNFATAGTSIANTTTTLTATNLTATTYYRAVIASGVCGPTNSATATITVSPKTWNGISWTPMGDPTSNDLVSIDGDYTITSINPVLNAYSLVIKSGKKLEVQAGTSLIIQNDLTVNASATLDVLDKGSLVMVKDSGIVTNTGTTKIHRITTPFKRYDYVYWSTPVENTSISSTFQTIGWNTNRAYEYIPGSDWSFASTMSPGKGYIVMVPTPTTFDVSEVIFSGKVNNGEKKITGVIADSSYLLGNPYPSAINADVFLDANAGVLDGTLYFWTHNTAIQLASNIAVGNAGSGAYAFTSDDYATYNRTGGVATAAAAKSSGDNTSIPTGKIASGQGFFASSNATIVGTNEIIFNNSMRLAGTTSLDNKTGVNEQFFRTSSTTKEKTANVLEKHRIWLDLKNSQGAFKQTLVGYISGATNDYDTRFDGASYDGNDFVDFYSINQDKNLTIQGRAVPFDENDTVPLGFKTTIAGSFTINIGQVDGDLTSQAVYLEDKVTNTVTNLKTGDYTFTTEVGTFDDRFVLRYTDKTLGLNDTDQADGILVFYSNNYKTLIIKNNLMDATVNSVVLFNTTGQRIANFDSKDSGQKNLQIPIKNIPSGIYIVKVKTTKGESSKKVIVN